MKKSTITQKKQSIQSTQVRQQQNKSQQLTGLSIQGTTTGVKQQQPQQQQKQQNIVKKPVAPVAKPKATIKKGSSVKKNPTQQKEKTENKQNLEINNQQKQIQQKNQITQQKEQNQEQQEKKQEEEEKQNSINQENKEKEEEEEKLQDEIGEITLKYSHYVKHFKIINGTLSKIDIDEELYLSGVFRGNFQMELKQESDKVIQESNKTHFLNIVNKNTYILNVIEDEEAESKVERKGYKASENVINTGIQKNQRVDDLTNQLKGLTQDELREKGEKYKQLIEARDLEDCLYN